MSMVPIVRKREDSLPENLEYRDTGCDIAPKCLECPLPMCRYDVPGGARALLNRNRNQRIFELSHGGEPARQIATELGMTERTVFRILAGG